MIATDFLDHADERIVQRGEVYFDSGRVGPLEELAPGLWHTVVRGTDDYQVDIRLRHGSVISAACSCPYAQRSALCKHIVAATLALESKDNAERADTPRFPCDASFAIARYAIEEFPLNHLDDEDWKAVRRVLEKLYGFPDLERTVIRSSLQVIDGRRRDQEDDQDKRTQRETRRERAIARLEESSKIQTRTVAQLHEETARRARRSKFDAADRATANMRILVPFFSPTHLDQLPHTWLTILEAAYEHLHDRDGLRRLYRLYIIIARTEPESVYVRSLRELSGSDWPQDRDAVIRFCAKHPATVLGMYNPAYERLLREERLGEVAFDYCRHRTDEVLIRMIDVVATDPQSSAKALEWLRDTLTDPDSAVYAKDTVDYARRIARWLHRIDDVYGYDEAKSLSEQIVSIFPRRMTLHDCLREYLCHADDEMVPPTGRKHTEESTENANEAEDGNMGDKEGDGDDER